MTPYVPLTIEGIGSKGEFLADANRALAELQAYLIRFAKRHEQSAKGAKSKLVLEITLEYAGKADTCDDITIKAAMRSSRPDRPAIVNLPVVGEDPVTGAPCLLVRKTGADDGDTRQSRMFTPDGDRIDPETGEVLAQGAGG